MESLSILLLLILNHKESDSKVQSNGEGAESERFSTVTKRRWEYDEGGFGRRMSTVADDG